MKTMRQVVSYLVFLPLVMMSMDQELTVNIETFNEAYNMLSSKSFDIVEFEKLLTNHPSILYHHPEASSLTLLHAAIENGNEKGVECILKKSNEKILNIKAKSSNYQKVVNIDMEPLLPLEFALLCHGRLITNDIIIDPIIKLFASTLSINVVKEIVSKDKHSYHRMNCTILLRWINSKQLREGKVMELRKSKKDGRLTKDDFKN